MAETSTASAPKSKRKLQKHLRSAGLAYISRTGKFIPAKRVADELCQCPHKCDELVPLEARQRLFTHFYGLGDADLQNQFLRRNMDLRARFNVPEPTSSGRAPRRITCKYLVPLMDDDDKTVEVCQKAFVSAFVITTKRVRLQREKLIASLGLNSYSSHNRSKFKEQQQHQQQSQLQQHLQKSPQQQGARSPPTLEKNNNTNATNNNIIDPETNVQLMPLNLSLNLLNTTCEVVNCNTSKEPKNSSRAEAAHPPPPKRTKRVLDDPMIPIGLVMPEGVTIAPVIATPDHDRDIAIVNNFFINQLWKPEYIGAYS